jgi:hypothetical protein
VHCLECTDGCGFSMVNRECAAFMANLHSKASVGNLTVVHKKYSHAKLLGVAKLPHAASLCSAHSST